MVGSKASYGATLVYLRPLPTARAKRLMSARVEAIAYVVTSGWASGISVYATVLVTGLSGRFGGLDSVPHAFERTDVLILAAILAAFEFVADKIPYVDSAWDAVHTVIRPAFGALMGGLIAGETGDLNQAVAVLLGEGPPSAATQRNRASGWRSMLRRSPCRTSSSASPRTVRSSASCCSRSTTPGQPWRSRSSYWSLVRCWRCSRFDGSVEALAGSAAI